MIKLSAAFSGLNFLDGIKRERNTLADASRVAVAAAAEGLKNELRQHVQSAGLGERLANTVGSKVYPRSGKSLHPAGLVYPRSKGAARIFEAFNEGVTVRAKSKTFLAIPTQNAWMGGRGGKRLSPQEFERRAGIKLTAIKSKKSGTMLLIGKRYRGRVRGASRQTLVYFILVRQVGVGRRLGFDAIAAKWSARVPDLIERALPQGN